MASFKPGDRVRLRELPHWVVELPQDSQAAFHACLGRVYRIADVDENGMLVLDAASDLDQRLGGIAHELHVEATWLDPA